MQDKRNTMRKWFLTAYKNDLYTVTEAHHMLAQSPKEAFSNLGFSYPTSSELNHIHPHDYNLKLKNNGKWPKRLFHPLNQLLLDENKHCQLNLLPLLQHKVQK